MSRSRRLSRRGGSQRGETLLETLVTVFIMTTVVVASLGSMFALSASAALHTRIVRSSNEAENIAEAFDQVPYMQCAALHAYETNPSLPVGNTNNQPVIDAVANIGSGYTFTTQKIEYLVSSSANPPTFTPTPCSPASADQGIERITIVIRSTASKNNGRAVLVFTKRNQTCVANNETVSGQPC